MLHLRKDGVHDGRYDIGDVLQREHHQPVRLVVITQLREAHVTSHEQLVEVAAEIVYQLERELVGREREYFAQRLASRAQAQRQRVLAVVYRQEHQVRKHRVDRQRVDSCPGIGCGDGGRAPCNLHRERPHGGEPEAFLLQDKGIGDDVGRGEKEVQREDAQDVAQHLRIAVERGDRAGCCEKQQRHDCPRPYREREYPAQVVPVEVFVLDDGRADAQIAEDGKEGDHYRGDVHHAELLGGEQARKDTRHHERYDDARVLCDRGVEYARSQFPPDTHFPFSFFSGFLNSSVARARPSMLPG